MNIVASTKSAKISPRKVRLVADAIRTQSPLQAVTTLLTVRQRGAQVLLKTLKAALSNAQNNTKTDTENLRFKEIQITEGSALKRFHPSSRGRTHPYKKRSSHVRIVLEEKGVAK